MPFCCGDVLHSRLLQLLVQPFRHLHLNHRPIVNVAKVRRDETRRETNAFRRSSLEYRYDLNLTRNSDMETICRAMQQPQSGLEIRDRVWLKLLLKSSFLGSDLVQWLYKYVDGFIDKQDAKEYAAALLERGYIRHPVAGLLTRGFSKSCYYVFGRNDDEEDNYTTADETQSQVNGLSQLTLEETTINYDALTRPIYGYVDKNNVPVLYASTSSLTSSYNNRKTKSQSSKDDNDLRQSCDSSFSLSFKVVKQVESV